jgi:hypothetical protein
VLLGVEVSRRVEQISVAVQDLVCFHARMLSQEVVEFLPVLAAPGGFLVKLRFKLVMAREKNDRVARVGRRRFLSPVGFASLLVTGY